MHRKTVTVVFCDVVGSTALGERTDPEALQALLARYFDQMQAIVERHGGSVEKFIGDAVMAVFGVPAVHEDDALRATRAAWEMRAAFGDLEVQGRIGVNTGEVVVGTAERLATGDAVNVAARLQQAAEPDQILLGETTLALVARAVDVQPLEALALKGKAQPVAVYRLDGVHDAPERQHDLPFVGRERESALLGAAWERASADGRCELFTVLGEAGVGKSRLVAEALAGHACVVRGRCLPYGEGITYWPVVEVVEQLGARPEDAVAADAISALLGEEQRAAGPEEIAWGFRKLLEQQAPLIVVFDDVQWGDDVFLDLVEGIALLASGAPILLLCMARPELLARRPEWPVAVRLEALPADAVDGLIAQLPGDVRARVAAAAGGNPLYLAEMLAMAGAGGAVSVPPSLRALLQARLDQLDGAERAILERAAVEGETFHRGALQALAPAGVAVTPTLAALARRQLVRPDRAQLAGEDGFRFRHLLIRDAAYEALPKAVRSELHQRFADWLDGRGIETVEIDEIVGYHLEQAARYAAELGRPDAELARRAAERLARSARRILRPGNDRTARALFARAVELMRPLALDVQLELDYAETVHWEDAMGAADLAAAAAMRARAAGDRLGEATARVSEGRYRVLADPAASADELEALALAALPLATEAGDHAALVRIWTALGYAVANVRQQMEAWTLAAERCIQHAREAGWPHGDAFGLASALVWGPRPADDALRMLDELADELSDPAYELKRAYLLAALTRFDEAWAVAEPAGEQLRGFGDAREPEWFGNLAALQGDYERAVRHVGAAVALTGERGLVGIQVGLAGQLGRWLCLLGRPEEAAPHAAFARTVDPGDWSWMTLQARVDAARGDHDAAELMAVEGVRRASEADQPTWQGDAWRDLGEVRLAAGRDGDAADAFEQALACYLRKGNLAMAAQVRPSLASVRAR